MVFIEDYLAICKYDINQIEAIINERNITVRPPKFLLRRLFGTTNEEDLENGNFSIELKNNDTLNNYTIKIGPASHLINNLSGRNAMRRAISLSIEGIPFANHDEAANILKKISNAIFFQVDLEGNIALTLTKDRRVRFIGRPLTKRAIESMKFPEMEYDDVPISLYWYARSATGMPLLQYLAFYQVIEFYYPTYSQAEARKRIKNILKNPSFRPDKDADIGKILSLFNNRGKLGDEKTQLKATITECTSVEELKTFILDDEDRKEFFQSKNKGISNFKIALQNEGSDLITQVCNRVYDIRCKIVHTKEDYQTDSLDILLPFSKEAEQLVYDIELIQYLSQKVLISASTKLNI